MQKYNVKRISNGEFMLGANVDRKLAQEYCDKYNAKQPFCFEVCTADGDFSAWFTPEMQEVCERTAQSVKCFGNHHSTKYKH